MDVDYGGSNTPGVGGALPLNTPSISSSIYTNGTNNVHLFRQGVEIGTDTINNGTVSTTPPAAVIGGIGRGSTTGQGNYNGQIAEVVIYKTNVTVAERHQIESYLALKYGITLAQTTAQNYLASDGTTKMWDSSLNTAYKYDIFGIGRDDTQALN